MIISAACRATVNGIKNVFPVHRHADFFLWMKLLHCDYDKNEVEQGFIDWNGAYERFVSREEAAKIAVECNQICRKGKMSFNPNCLYSEDIY